ncbi:hypothetical protein EVA_13827, partial [gut metagenome]
HKEFFQIFRCSGTAATAGLRELRVRRGKERIGDRGAETGRCRLGEKGHGFHRRISRLIGGRGFGVLSKE